MDCVVHGVAKSCAQRSGLDFHLQAINVVIVSGERRRDSGIDVSVLPQTPSHPGWHVTLSIVLCAIP